MPKRQPKPRRPAPITFVERMYAVRFKRTDGTHFLACGVYGHPRLHGDRADAETFRASLAKDLEEWGRVVPVRVTIQEVTR